MNATNTITPPEKLSFFESEVLRLVRSEPNCGISKMGVWNSTVHCTRTMQDIEHALYKLEDMNLITIKPRVGSRHVDSTPCRMYLPVELTHEELDGQERLAEIINGAGGPIEPEPFQSL